MESDAGKKQFFAKNLSSVKAGLNFDSIRSLQIMVPPLDIQNEFISFVQQIDKSKFEAKQALEYITAAQKTLMRQHLGN
jgi:type I restriction enzyme S subunit